MGISTVEFQTAMETYGAKRLPDGTGSRYRINVPSFKVGETVFLHSGSYYIVQSGKYASNEIMEKAMAEFGEKKPGGSNFWYGEIHSIRGILTLAAMIENRYSKELVNKLTDETYQKFFDSSTGLKNTEQIHFATTNQRLEEISKLIKEYSSLVNPFSSEEFKAKKPSEYLDKVSMEFFAEEDKTTLECSSNSGGVQFANNPRGWSYFSLFNNNPNDEKRGYTEIVHYYCKESGKEKEDEVLYIHYRATDGYEEHPSNFDLRISLKTGLAWETYHEEAVAPVTEEQLEWAIIHLKYNMKRIKERILVHIIDQQE